MGHLFCWDRRKEGERERPYMYQRQDSNPYPCYFVDNLTEKPEREKETKSEFSQEASTCLSRRLFLVNHSPQAYDNDPGGGTARAPPSRKRTETRIFTPDDCMED